MVRTLRVGTKSLLPDNDSVQQNIDLLSADEVTFTIDPITAEKSAAIKKFAEVFGFKMTIKSLKSKKRLLILTHT